MSHTTTRDIDGAVWDRARTELIEQEVSSYDRDFSGSISRISAFFLFVGWVCRTTNLVFATEKIPISLLAVTEGRVEVLVIIRVAFFDRIPCGSKKVRVLPRWFTLLFYSFFVVEVKLSNFIDMFLGLFDFCVVDLELFLIVLIIGEL